MREERRVGRYDDDDGAAFGFAEGSVGVGGIFGDFEADGYASDAEIRTAAVIALDEDTLQIIPVPPPTLPSSMGPP
jgi:hypothetical protein